VPILWGRQPGQPGSPRSTASSRARAPGTARESTFLASSSFTRQRAIGHRALPHGDVDPGLPAERRPSARAAREVIERVFGAREPHSTTRQRSQSARYLNPPLAPHFPEESSSRNRSPRLKVEAAHHIFVNTVATDAYFSFPTIGRLSPHLKRRCQCATGARLKSPTAHHGAGLGPFGRTK